MTESANNERTVPAWITGEISLAGMLDSRMIGLLRAIEQSGSINRAAKQMGLSYKGAWQIIERANNGAPKALVATATGGSKGGGTSLTGEGRALLALYSDLERQHHQFLDQLNRRLAEDPDAVLLLQRLVVKTSARNQLFGRIESIHSGAVHAEVVVALKGGELVVVTIPQASLNELGLTAGDDAVLLINSSDILLLVDEDDGKSSTPLHVSARNQLSGHLLRIRRDSINAELTVLLPGGETLAVTITERSAQHLGLTEGMAVRAMFKSNAPILGAMVRD